MLKVGNDEDDNTKASTLILDGVELDENEEKYFFDRINKLHNLFPFDSYVELTLQNDARYLEFYGKLQITTFEKKFVSEHLGLDLYNLYDQLQVEIEELARSWYKDWPMNKFAQIYYSMMKNDSTWRM